MCPKGGKIYKFAFMIQNIEDIKGHRVKTVSFLPSLTVMQFLCPWR